MGIKHSLQSTIAVSKAMATASTNELKSELNPLPQYVDEAEQAAQLQSLVRYQNASLSVGDAALDVGPMLTAIGTTITVSAFTVDTFTHPGGSVTIPVAGQWFVGVDLFSRALITLPRLGHRGWIALARVVRAGETITVLQKLSARMPKCRIPRTVSKIAKGLGLNVLTMGSSLVEGGSGTTDWTGMLFNSASSVTKYRIPGTITFRNYGLGGSPNQYQLAQTGIASACTAIDYGSAGAPMTLTNKLPPNGRSTMFNDVDLVVIGMFANGGDYRIQTLEPIIRNLRKIGVEVLVTTDNPQGYPFASYDGVQSSGLYTDGPELFRIADLYGVEVADTAAYVVESLYRYPEVSTYRDSIHMAFGAPAGRVGVPSSGYEVYARAVRSCIPVDAQGYGTTNASYGFDASEEGFITYGPGTSPLTTSAGKLVITKQTSSSVQWGAQRAITPVRVGDTVRVTGTITVSGWNPSIGIYSGGWASNSPGLNSGAFDLVLTLTKDASTAHLLFFGNYDNAPAGTSFTVDNVSITVNSTYESSSSLSPVRDFEPQVLPPSRYVTDYKTPGDAFVILPKDERRYVTNYGAKGTLAAHPQGANSFARRFSGAVGASEDLLTLAAGQSAACAAMGVVGFSVIHYPTVATAITFDVYRSNALIKTVTISNPLAGREAYYPILTPTELATTNATPDNATIDIRVTSGVLNICALVCLTSEMEYIPSDTIFKQGTWTRRPQAANPTQWTTDTLDDQAVLEAPKGTRRVFWIVAGRANSKPVDMWSSRNLLSAQATAGVSHVHAKGNTLGEGQHTIKLAVTQSNSDQATNGYGLGIYGAIAVMDR